MSSSENKLLTEAANQLKTNPERNKSSHKIGTKITAFIALAAMSLMSGCAAEAKNNEKLPNTASPSNITEKASPNIPAEADRFMSQYGNRFSDPLAAYYAQKAYNAEYQKGLLLTDPYIDSYDMAKEQYNQVSPLGFTKYQIPLDKNLDQKASIDVFNQYTAKELSLYMNTLASNPAKEAVAIIDDQFTHYCSGKGSEGTPLAFTTHDEPVSNLMKLAKDTVAKYGSSAIYKVAEASVNSSNKDATLFDISSPTKAETVPFFNDTQSITEFTDGNVKILIDVDIYDDNNNVVKKQDSIDGVTITTIRQPITGPLNEATKANISIGIK